MKHLFYFDESFHDRKIKNKNGKVNIHQENASDSYVAVFVGGSMKLLSELEKRYYVFEHNHKNILGLDEDQELKGTTISKKNFVYGLNSFNKKTVTFYKDFFEIFTDGLYLQINILSKTAQVVELVFKEIDFKSQWINKKAFLYSMTKSLNTYRFNSVLIQLFNERGSFNNKRIINELVNSYSMIINSSSASLKKTLERNAFRDLISILNRINKVLNISTEYAFDYDFIFDSFDAYIKKKSLNPKNIDLYIDNETNTLEAANRKNLLSSVTSLNSPDSWGIRVSDILSNFIGRMIKALFNDLKEPSINNNNEVETYNFSTKKLLNENWFVLNEERFDLYKCINAFFENTNSSFYSSNYFDYCLLLKALINYFFEFSSFDEYKRVLPETHAEQFNSYCCTLMIEQYNRF